MPITTLRTLCSHLSSSVSLSPTPLPPTPLAAPAAASGGGACSFKLACWLDELSNHSTDEALAIAKSVGAEYVWFTNIYDEGGQLNSRWLWELSDAEIDALVAKVAAHGLKLYQICTRGNPNAGAGCFHNIRVEDVSPNFLSEQGTEFRQDLDALLRSMEIAHRLGVGAVICYSMGWSGEWKTTPGGTRAGRMGWTQSPSFAMKWATHGGIISELELESLAAIFRHVTDRAEQLDLDVILSMRPFHFNSCTRNFVAIAERVGSPRLKCQWGAADCVVSNERDWRQSFERVRPYLHGLHLKDATTGNGPIGDIDWTHDWVFLGTGEVQYPAIFRLLAQEHVGDLFLGVCTHTFDASLPVEEQQPAAMARNFDTVRGWIAAAQG